jgi:hypothetical protein
MVIVRLAMPELLGQYLVIPNAISGNHAIMPEAIAAIGHCGWLNARRTFYSHLAGSAFWTCVDHRTLQPFPIALNRGFVEPIGNGCRFLESKGALVTPQWRAIHASAVNLKIPIISPRVLFRDFEFKDRTRIIDFLVLL